MSAVAQYAFVDGYAELLMRFGAFHFFELSEIHALDVHHDEGGCSLSMLVSGSERLVWLKFEGVQRALLPTFSPRAFLSHFDIEDVSSNQWEGISVRAASAEYGDRCEVLARRVSVRAASDVDEARAPTDR